MAEGLERPLVVASEVNVNVNATGAETPTLQTSRVSNRKGVGEPEEAPREFPEGSSRCLPWECGNVQI